MILYLHHTNCSLCEVAQSCPTLCDPMDCSLPGFSVHGIFQARVLEWVAISFSIWLLLEPDLFTYILSSCWALPRVPQQDGAELSPRFPGKALILDL